jgi:hypothetical protein
VRDGAFPFDWLLKPDVRILKGKQLDNIGKAILNAVDAPLIHGRAVGHYIVAPIPTSVDVSNSLFKGIDCDMQTCRSFQDKPPHCSI